MRFYMSLVTFCLIYIICYVISNDSFPYRSDNNYAMIYKKTTYHPAKQRQLNEEILTCDQEMNSIYGYVVLKYSDDM